MEGYLKALEGISYLEWKKLRHAIDQTFEKQKDELERDLQLAPSAETMRIFRSLFG